MKKYITFSLAIVLFSLSLIGQNETFRFNNSTSSGATLTNWVETTTGANPTSSDFLDATNYFDCDGYSVDLDGLIIGNTNFVDGWGGGSFINTGTLYIRSALPPSFNITPDFTSNANTVIYDYSLGQQNLVIGLDYYNVTLSNGRKLLSTGTFKVNYLFKTTSTLIFDVSAQITIYSTTTFNFFTGTEILIKYSTPLTVNSLDGYNFYDFRTTKSYPEKWTIYGGHRSSTITHNLLYSGTYNTLTIQRLANPIKLTGNTTVNAILDISNTQSSAGKGIFSLDGFTLTVQGTLTSHSSGILIKGNSTSSIICGATGTLYFNQSGTDSVLQNLTINNSKTVTLGNNLKIVGGSNFGVVTVESGATLNTNGYLTLRSHQGGSAMIGNSPGTISGSINVETFIPATARRFRFLASPVTGATATHWRNNGTYTKYKGIQITGGGANWSTKGFDESLTNNPSAFYYNEAAAGDDTTVSPGASNDAGWTEFGTGAEALTNGKGFRVLVRGDRGIDLKGTGGSTTPIATTLKVTGSYVGSSAIINVTNSGRTKLNNGINFIGNPYPCTIDWQALTLTNVHSHYLIYDPSGNRYRAWNGTTGGAGRYISSGQAFLVYCTSTSGGSITVDESDKVTNTTGGGFFQTKLTNHLKIELAYDTLNLDETYIHFRDDASNKLDEYDVRQVKNSGVNIASMDSANLAYNINSLGSLTGNRRIPLSVEGTAVSNGFQMTFNDVASFPNHKIYLTDNFKGTKTLIQEAMTVIIDITNDKSTYTNGRFFLDFEEIAQTKVAKINTSFGATLFPNPSTDDINLSFTKNYENKNVNYEINTIQGEKVLTGKIHISNDNKINIKGLSSGLYIINISNNQLSQSIQFIKK